jgi:cellobiose phosphorylase
MLEKIKELLGGIAPTIATSLGGPIGGLAWKALTSVFGVNEDASEEEVFHHLTNMTHEQRLAIIQENNRFKKENFELENKDRERATKREVALANSKWGWISLSMMNLAAMHAMGLNWMITHWALYKQTDPQIQTMVLTFDLTSVIALFFCYIWGKSKRDNNSNSGE